MYHIVIPARYSSTRLPAKALAEINGKPMVYWVWRQALQSSAVSVTVATDDERIRSALSVHGAEVVMTDPTHPSGTDRLAEVGRLKGWDDGSVVVNLRLVQTCWMFIKEHLLLIIYLPLVVLLQ